jgi:hypothetical protein
MRPAPSSISSKPSFDLDLAGLLRLQQRVVVAFVLIRVALGELGDRPVEGVAATDRRLLSCRL